MQTCAGLSHLTGDLKGDAAIDPETTRPLLPRGAWATRGMVMCVVVVLRLSKITLAKIHFQVNRDAILFTPTACDMRPPRQLWAIRFILSPLSWRLTPLGAVFKRRCCDWVPAQLHRLLGVYSRLRHNALSPHPPPPSSLCQCRPWPRTLACSATTTANLAC